MLHFPHLFSDLHSLTAGMAVKRAPLYLPSMIEKGFFDLFFFCSEQLQKEQKNKLLSKDFLQRRSFERGGMMARLALWLGLGCNIRGPAVAACQG